MRKKKAGYNWYKLLLCGLVFFVIGGTAFCMAAESKESAEKKARIEAELAAEAADRKGPLDHVSVPSSSSARGRFQR